MPKPSSKLKVPRSRSSNLTAKELTLVNALGQGIRMGYWERIDRSAPFFYPGSKFAPFGFVAAAVLKSARDDNGNPQFCS